MQIEEVGVGERVARAIHSVCIILAWVCPCSCRRQSPIYYSPYFVVACGICSFKNFHCKKKIDNLILESYGYPHNLAQCLAHIRCSINIC